MKKVLMIIVIVIALINVVSTAAFEPWGLAADDGSSIQPFTPSVTTGKDFRIPQDSTLIQQDTFDLYLEWHSSQTTREVIVQFYKPMERVIYVGDTQETEFYWELYVEKTIELTRGNNEWQDSRFALLTIDSNTIPEFQKADLKERIVILYRDVEIEFFHKTSYSQFEQTKTTAQWNLEWLILGAWALFLAFIAGWCSRYILHKVTYVPDLPPWYFWGAIFMALIAGAGIFFLISGYNLDEIILMIGLLPAPLVLVAGAMYFAFWLASMFRPSKLREIAFIILDMPKLEEVKSGKRKLRDERDLPTDIEILEGYIDKDGDYNFINDPQSYWEMFRRMKIGGVKIDMGRIADRISVKQKKKNFDDIIWCEKFEKRDLEVKVRENAFLSFSSLIILIGVLTWVLPLIFAFPSVILAILGSAFLASGLFMFLWENVEITAPFIDITPITDRAAIDIIRDKLTIDLKNQEISELEMDVYEEKANISRRARKQTLTAMEEAERAHMPYMEDQERQDEPLEMPEPFKQAMKTWYEKNWGKMNRDSDGGTPS